MIRGGKTSMTVDIVELAASATFAYVQYILAKRREEGERSRGERASDVKVNFVCALLERRYSSRSHLQTSCKHEFSSICN